MKLSEAIILGDTLKKCEPGIWLSEDGSCGCAFGGALLAVGISAEDYHGHRMYFMHEHPLVLSKWPWITEPMLVEISNLYTGVARGEKTIEDVAAYVKTVEPSEHAPAEDSCDEQPSPEEIDYLLGGYNDPAYERNGR